MDRDGQPRWGQPPWRVDYLPPPAPPPRRCDVAVVGGGLTGLSTAYHLARRGARVALFEAGRLGAGASGRTGGIPLEGTAAGALDGVERCLDALAAVVVEAGIACDLDLPGCWELEHRPAPGGPRSCWRDGDRWLCATGTVAGGTLDPGRLVAGLARAAVAAGASLHEHTPVGAIAPEKPGRLIAGAAVVQAERIVCALNAYTAGIVPLPVPLHTALTLGVCTSPLPPDALAALGLADGRPFYTLDLPYLWGRPLNDGRLILGAGLVFAETGDLDCIPIDGPGAVAAFAGLVARIAGFHPALAGAALREHWAGPIAFPPDRVPILSRVPGRPEVIVTGGCTGHGIALGVRIGQLIADALAGGAELPAWGALPEAAR